MILCWKINLVSGHRNEQKNVGETPFSLNFNEYSDSYFFFKFIQILNLEVSFLNWYSSFQENYIKM